MSFGNKPDFVLERLYLPFLLGWMCAVSLILQPVFLEQEPSVKPAKTKNRAKKRYVNAFFFIG